MTIIPFFLPSPSLARLFSIETSTEWSKKMCTFREWMPNKNQIEKLTQTNHRMNSSVFWGRGRNIQSNYTFLGHSAKRNTNKHSNDSSVSFPLTWWYDVFIEIDWQFTWIWNTRARFRSLALAFCLRVQWTQICSFHLPLCSPFILHFWDGCITFVERVLFKHINDWIFRSVRYTSFLCGRCRSRVFPEPSSIRLRCSLLPRSTSWNLCQNWQLLACISDQRKWNELCHFEPQNPPPLQTYRRIRISVELNIVKFASLCI